MPSVGSSRISRRGRVDERAGDRQLLLLAAGKIAAAAMQHVLQHREQREDLVRDVAQAARQRWRSRSPGFRAPTGAGRSRGPAAPAPARRGRARAAGGSFSSRSSQRMRPERIGLKPEDRAQQAGLADPVAAEDAGHLALFRGQADPAQRMAGAVIQIDRFDRQHRSALKPTASRAEAVIRASRISVPRRGTGWPNSARSHPETTGHVSIRPR